MLSFASADGMPIEPAAWKCSSSAAAKSERRFDTSEQPGPSTEFYLVYGTGFRFTRLEGRSKERRRTDEGRTAWKKSNDERFFEKGEAEGRVPKEGDLQLFNTRKVVALIN